MAAAGDLLDQFLRTIETLETFPELGAGPKALEGLGMWEFGRLMLRHFRLIYRVIGACVVIMMIADGRRDMRELLERRLLGRRH